MIFLWELAYYVPGLPKDLRIIYPQVIRKSEVCKVSFISHCHDENNSYAYLKFKEDIAGWQRKKTVERFYINYEPKNNLPTSKNILSNHI